jgi:two-component system chemotaxis response regulator CheB
MKRKGYRAVVIGVSAGGSEALSGLFSHLPGGFPLPMIVVQHVHPTQDGSWFGHFNAKCTLKVKEAGDKESIRPGHIYFAPPGYHLLVERDETFALSVDDKVNYARPSIDVLFESAAYVWSPDLIGIILTGANHDGARGLCLIREYGGLTIAQDPASAEHPVMPQAAIDAGGVGRILSLDEIGGFLSTLRAPR